MKRLILIGLIFLFQAAFCFDLSDYGSFSDRSTIMNSLNKEDRLTQEQKDLLKQKKLAPTTACLIDQIKKKKNENVALLLESKVNPNESFYTEYPIYTAAKHNNFEAVKLLSKYGAKLDKGFFSELYEAVKNKNTEMAEFLLDKGARVNYRDSVSENTILYYAVKNDMTDIATRLIQKGAKLDTKSKILIKKKKLQPVLYPDM